MFACVYDQSLILGASAVSNDGSITLNRGFRPNDGGLIYTSSRGYDLVIVWTASYYCSFSVRLWLLHRILQLERGVQASILVKPQSAQSWLGLLEPAATLGESDNAILKMDDDEFLWVKTRWEDAPRDTGKDLHGVTRLVIDVDVTKIDRTNAVWI